ncbi:hypothetical protein ACFY7C_37475 [Streptomyces sp. NPDC012769]|uniref:hypothetical protein n=1 Tax=Streptomyces sp. NPDC012769 TaxID=3364848 RepID=UPI0036BB70E0
MSTMRRPLGTGPTTSTRTTTTSTAPRLLPVERAEPSALEDAADDDQEQAEPKRRRTLGTGPAGTT